MKKLLGIIVMGLLLMSCSENNKKRMLENCADEMFEKEKVRRRQHLLLN